MPREALAAGPKLTSLLAAAPCNPLGAGQSDRAQRDKLQALTPEALGDWLTPARAVADRTMALACLSGLWLRFNYLDESHRISQDLENPTGSFWHGIMHRREGDFGNAKYWFRRVGDHPVYGPLNDASRELATSALSSTERLEPDAEYLTQQTHWDSSRFVDLCEDSLDNHSANELLCRKIQQREWELLFDFCLQQAFGK